MDNRLVMLAIVVAASGCLHTGLNDISNTNSPTSSSSGLQVAKFDVSDGAIGPGQTGIIYLELVNNHREEIDIKDISIYNTGVLNVEKSGCNPSEIGPAREDYVPRMECNWRVKVPEDAVDRFDSKMIPVKLNLEYESQVSNSQSPIKTHFYPIEEISSTRPLKSTFSNSEVGVTVETERPIPYEGRTVTFTAQNAGNGRVASNFTFEYFPEEIFDGCKKEHKPIIDQKVEFTCMIQPQREVQQTRNLVISTSYKYVKEPTLDIEVVDTS